MSSIDINANCTDVPVFRFNITISNSTDEIFSFESTDSTNDVITIDETLSLVDLGVGNYTVQYECADPHTSKKIDNYNIRKNSTFSKLRYTASTVIEGETKLKQNSYEISYPSVNTVNITDYGTTKSSDGSKYQFWYDTGLVADKTQNQSSCFQ